MNPYDEIDDPASVQADARDNRRAIAVAVVAMLVVVAATGLLAASHLLG